MTETPIRCPYCGGWLPEEATICADCHEDLAALVRLARQHAIYYNEALSLAREGDLEAARLKLLMALERNGRFLPAQRLLTKVAAAQGDWALARRSAARALDLAPEDDLVRRLAAEVEAEATRQLPPAARRQAPATPPADPSSPPAPKAAGRPARHRGLLGAVFGLTSKEDRH